MGHSVNDLTSLASSVGLGSLSELEAVPKGWQETTIWPEVSMPGRAALLGYSTLRSVCTTHSESESETHARMQMSEQCKTPKTQRARAVS